MFGMELNKIFAAVLLAGIIAMSAGFVAELLIHPAPLEQNAYVVDTGAAPAEVASAEDAELPPIAPLLASADPAAGETLSRACVACHSFDQGGANKVGPNLWNVVGGPKAHLDDFNYSGALQEAADAGGEWGYEELNGFLAAPRTWLPGTTMSYAGLRNEGDRADLIAWLRTLSDSPVPLPEAAQ